jgi:prolyl 4-hydroxylase
MKRQVVYLIVAALLVSVILGIHYLGSANKKARIDEEGPKGLAQPLWQDAECLQKTSPFIYRLNRFLSPMECKHIIEAAQARFKPSLVVSESTGNDKYDVSRTSWSAYLDRQQTSIIRSIEERAAKVFGVPVECIEPLQVVRYYPGQKFDAHHDFFQHMSGTAGQRYATILVYLNDDFEGGETAFPKCKVVAKPITGDGVCWYNCYVNGDDGRCYCLGSSLHQGQPPSRGTKYALNIWLRFEPF